MKTSTDPRHLKRTQIIKDLYAYSFHKKNKLDEFGQSIVKNLDKIDDLIKLTATQWPLEKIAKVDLAILRLAVNELVFDKREPPKVIIDEAVELAKEFGAEASAPFVNGVLGTIIKKV